MKLDFFDAQIIEFKALTDPYTFEGYLSVFNKKDSQDDIIVPGAFSETLKKYPKVKLLWQHDRCEIIGTFPLLQEDSKGLKFVAKLTQGVEKAEEAYLLLKDGAIDEMSVGFSIGQKGIYEMGADGVRTIKKIERLYEGSLVTWAANSAATVNRVKAADNAREMEHALREAGMKLPIAKMLASRLFHGEEVRPEDLRDAAAADALERFRRAASGQKN